TNPDEVGQEFSFTLQVTDSCEGGPQTAQADFTFTLQPAACVPPTITTKALPDPVLDEPYSAAVEATGGIAPYGFTLVAGALPSGLTLNPDGTLTGSADDSKEVGQAFTFTVEVADSCTPTPATDTQEYTITVRPAPCVPAEITNTGFPDPVLNQAYNASLLATGEAPFTWQLLAGTLPTGLTVDPAGFLRGTPSAVNEVGRAFTFTLEVTDACPQGPQSAQAEFTVTLQGEVCTNPDIQTTDLDDPVLGTPYTARIQATGGVTPYTFAIDAGVLPRGLTLGSNGTITGTPDNPEEIGRDFTFDVRVTDSCTPTPGFDVQSLIMTLQPAACAEIRITNEGFADPVLGEVYSADLTAEGEAPFTWSLVAGSLPTGLAVDPAGTITGTPTDPAQVNRPFTFTLQVADSCLNGPQTAQAEFTVTLQPAHDCTDPVILTTELPNPTFGQPYMARIETTDGVEPYTFALIGGALPAGLDLDPLGAITGTPNDAEEIGREFPFTVQVTDSCPFTPGTDTQDLVIVVQPAPCEPLAIANTGFADPVLGQAYNATLFATGGVPPYAWALASTSGPLPSGLTVDPSGAIMGTPDDPEQVGRPFTFTLEATDACPLGAQTSQAEFTVTLQPAPDCPDPAITTTELANPVLGEPYNQPLEVAGGEAPFTFEVLKGGVLPTGIALSSEGVLSGTPENLEEVGIQFSFTVQVTDSCEFGAGVDTESYTITLQPEPCTDLVILNTGFADPVLGQAYNASLLADGEPPFIWEFLDGSLPAGLTVEPEGILGGTPTDPKEVGQEFTFTLQVSDVCNDVPRAVEGTFTFTLQPAEACDPPVIQDPEATDPVFGQEYLLQFTATGGVEPYTWSLDEGVLPEGLSFTPEGTITGTPTDPNQVGIRFPVQVQVADNCPFAPGTDTFDLLLVVQPP
ncbi:MAG TPA: Ig domain-containing protein, partial [bacterium]|nr:Ig domain-containing protein [bacterium]